MSTQGLPRVDRIRRRPDFERVYSPGRAHFRPFHDGLRAPDRITPDAAGRRRHAETWQRRCAKSAPSAWRGNSSGARSIAGGYDIVIVPRRELLDAPSPHSKPTIRPPSTAARRLRPRRVNGPSVAAGVVLALISAYKVFVFSAIYGVVSVRAVLFGVYGRGGADSRCAVKGVGLGLRRLARCHPFGGYGFSTRVSGEPQVIGPKWNAGFYSPSFCRLSCSLRVPGNLRPAAAARTIAFFGLSDH